MPRSTSLVSGLLVLTLAILGLALGLPGRSAEPVETTLPPGNDADASSSSDAPTVVVIEPGVWIEYEPSTEGAE